MAGLQCVLLVGSKFHMAWVECFAVVQGGRGCSCRKCLGSVGGKVLQARPGEEEKETQGSRAVRRGLCGSAEAAEDGRQDRGEGSKGMKSIARAADLQHLATGKFMAGTLKSPEIYSLTLCCVACHNTHHHL